MANEPSQRMLPCIRTLLHQYGLVQYVLGDINPELTHNMNYFITTYGTRTFASLTEDDKLQIITFYNSLDAMLEEHKNSSRYVDYLSALVAYKKDEV